MAGRGRRDEGLLEERALGKRDVYQGSHQLKCLYLMSRLWKGKVKETAK